MSECEHKWYDSEYYGVVVCERCGDPKIHPLKDVSLEPIPSSPEAKVAAYHEAGRREAIQRQVRFVRTHEDAVLPVTKRVGDAGYDLYAVLKRPLVLPAFTPMAIGTGWKIAIPEGYEGQIRPRSGMALRGITVANSPGTIDENYRGDLAVILVNLSGKIHSIKHGDRIAQLLVKKVEHVGMVEVDSFDDETDRGEDGFGSSGR